MSVILFVAVVGLVAGLLAGGSLRNFERVRVHWWGVAVAGSILQVVPTGDRWGDGPVTLLVASYGLLLAFVWVNRRLPAAPLLLVGLALNAIVIGVNGGMPVSESAIRTAGHDGGDAANGRSTTESITS